MTTVRLCPLAEVAHRLPADCWIAQRLAEEPDALADEATLWITGGAHWPALHLDAPHAQLAVVDGRLVGGQLAGRRRPCRRRCCARFGARRRCRCRVMLLLLLLLLLRHCVRDDYVSRVVLTRRSGL